MPASATVILQEKKLALRRDARERRSRIPRAVASSAADGLFKRIIDSIAIAAGSIVSGYWPIGDEIDVRPLMNTFHEIGHPMALPVVVKRDAPLAFRAWAPGATLVRSVFGTSVPPDSVPELVPGALFVPALAIDNAGYRLGYGGGYYDRTLDTLRGAAGVVDQPVTIGICYECQRYEKLPHDESDERLDWIVTEIGVKQVP
jgi:5-formyltetrahydrofolate cyclo-ligase